MNNSQDQSLSQMSDEELIAIIRKAENTYVPGSRYNLAKTELDLRHAQGFSELVSNKNGGIHIESRGDMINNGTIITDSGAYVKLRTQGTYTSNKGKIIQGKNTKKWWESSWFQIICFVSAILGIVGFFHLI